MVGAETPAEVLAGSEQGSETIRAECLLYYDQNPSV